MYKNIIKKEERARNLEIIKRCETGLHFVHIDCLYRDEHGAIGGMGYASLIYNGREVDLDGGTGKTLQELNDENYVLEIYEDEIPPAFQPKDLIQLSIFNQWK